MMNPSGSGLGWALVRVVFGLSLAYGHGLPKAMGDVDRFASGVAQMGFPYPLFFAWCAILSELVGGVLVAVGLFTRPAAFLAAFTLAVAIYRDHASFGVLEKALLFLLVMVALVMEGAGPYSLDAKRWRRM